MSETPDAGDAAGPPDTESQLNAIADAFDRESDPLAELAVTFERTGVDPFEVYVVKVLEPRGLSARTVANYRRAFRHWRAFMAREGRHPACPNEHHVKRFIQSELTGRENGVDTTKHKLNRLNSAYTWWQDHHAFPHPHDYNPFKLARAETDLQSPAKKEPPRIPVETLRDILADITNVRDRALIVTQLKLGLRAGEVCNIKLAEVDIQNVELRRHYPEMGTHPRLADHDRENAIYIPSRDEREGNKSKRPRVLPLDDEMRRVLLEYLAVRPDVPEPWLFLSTTRYEKIRDPDKITRVWKQYFRPEYAETDQHRAVTSHFGRHRFSTYWRIEQDENRELIQYMRGDKFGVSMADRGGIDHYLHTYYEDIEPVYRANIYKLGV